MPHDTPSQDLIPSRSVPSRSTRVPHAGAFETRHAGSYDPRQAVCDTFHGARRGSAVEHAGQDFLMTAPFFESRSGSQTSPWTASTNARSYLIAGLRAAVIALVLLGVLALVVLF